MIAIIILIVINLMILQSMVDKKKGSDEKDWTVYGTMACGWTRKQLDYMKNRGVSHAFVDCDKGGACPGMNAFPTMVHKNGEKIVGFKEV
jgi:hypothetical protein